MPKFPILNIPPFVAPASELGIETSMEVRRRFHEVNNAFTHLFLRIDRIEQWAVNAGDAFEDIDKAAMTALTAAADARTAVSEGDRALENDITGLSNRLTEKVTNAETASVERTNELERTISRRTIGFLISLFFVIVPILVGMLYKILDLITLLGRNPA